MNLPNDKLLLSLRVPGRCEWCKKPCSMLCGVHIFSKGAGRLDHMINLASLGMDAVLHCPCHHDSHKGLRPTTYDLLEIVGKREGLHPETIKDTVDAIRAVPAKLSLGQIEMWIDEHVARNNVAELAFAIIKDWWRECR